MKSQTNAVYSGNNPVHHFTVQGIKAEDHGGQKAGQPWLSLVILLFYEALEDEAADQVEGKGASCMIRKIGNMVTKRVGA